MSRPPPVAPWVLRALSRWEREWVERWTEVAGVLYDSGMAAERADQTALVRVGQERQARQRATPA